jgi:serine/threonine protein kinase
VPEGKADRHEECVALSKLVVIEGERLDRFELVAELASGGMATVYLARLGGVGGFQRFVAIKRLHPHLARDNEFIEMFLDEARLAARIHHPNVVPILEIGESPEGYYLVMEYIEGDTLGRILARSAQSQERVPSPIGVRMVLDALAGLHAAHELKDDDGKALEIVHRDVSPQNILVGVDGSARITDFGVARAASRLSTTRSGQLKGKLAYMSPEQAKAQATVDRRADIFAMGTVLWEVLACKRLFKGDGDADTLNRVLHEPIPSLRSVAPHVPAALESVVMKALERERDRRYATAAEFADALERVARVVGTLAAPREVATYIEFVIGTEISQQREAVRAWLARSEPSRQGVPKRESARPEPMSETKVEGTRRRDASQPTSDSSVSSAVVEIPPPEPTSKPSGVSAVNGVTGVTASDPSGPQFLEKKRSRVWPAAFALLVVGGAAGVMMTRWQGAASRAGATAPAVANVTPVLPLPAVATVTSSASASASATIVSPASASAAAPEPIDSVRAFDASAASATPQRPKPPARTTRPVPPPKADPAPPSAPAVPDDISKNPYR